MTYKQSTEHLLGPLYKMT